MTDKSKAGHLNHLNAMKKDPTKPKPGERKNWFKRLLERIAKANQESGGQVCSS
jgi:hypothetical protein